ncbi:MAG TPA: signal peptidase II [Limnochordales bacterium]
MTRWAWVAWAALVLAADQLSKAAVQARLAVGESVLLAGGWVRLTHLRNSGAAFGLFSGQQALFVVATGAVVALAVLWSCRAAASPASPGRGVSAGLGLASGGAVANLADRLRHGAVVDFIDVRLWPVFNVADAAIVVGVALLAWRLLVGGGRGRAAAGPLPGRGRGGEEQG